MYRLISALSLFVTLAVGALAQAPVSLPPSQISAYRPTGEQRLWTFVVRDSSVGRLISTVSGPAEIGDQTGIGITEQLSLNYQKVGGELAVQIQSKHLVSEAGHYLGDQMTIKTGDQTDTLELVRAGERVEGYITRGGIRQPTSLPTPVDRAAWDMPFVDQLELYLAVHGVTVGQVIQDTVIAPHPMLAEPIKGVVEGFGRANIYNQIYDSVFVILLSEPKEMRLLFNRQRHLVKVEIPQEQTKIYLDAVTQPKSAPESNLRSVTPVIILSRIPAYLVYLIVGGIVLLFFAGRGIRSVQGYFGFVLAAAVYWLVPFTQVPLQEAIIVHKMLPAVRAGESVFLWAVWPALIAGIIQTSLLAGCIALVKTESKKGPDQFAILGAFCGAGFGLMEACYFTATVPFFTLASYGLIERLFVLIFQISAGLILGLGLRRGYAFFLQTAIWLTLVNALLRYIPAFAQQRIMGPELLSVLLALVSLAVMFTAVLLSKKRSSAASSHHPKHSS